LVLYCDLVARAVIDGCRKRKAEQAIDVGAWPKVPVEHWPQEHAATAH